MVKGLKYKTEKEQLGSFGLFSLEEAEGCPQGNFTPGEEDGRTAQGEVQISGGQ